MDFASLGKRVREGLGVVARLAIIGDVAAVLRSTSSRLLRNYHRQEDDRLKRQVDDLSLKIAVLVTFDDQSQLFQKRPYRCR